MGVFPSWHHLINSRCLSSQSDYIARFSIASRWVILMINTNLPRRALHYTVKNHKRACCPIVAYYSSFPERKRLSWNSDSSLFHIQSQNRRLGLKANAPSPSKTCACAVQSNWASISALHIAEHIVSRSCCFPWLQGNWNHIETNTSFAVDPH